MSVSTVAGWLGRCRLALTPRAACAIPASMTERDDFHALMGFTLLEWRNGFARLALDVQPKHLNRAGILHGGVLLTMLDEVGAMGGLWCSVPGNRRMAVTVELSGHFTGQANGGRIVAVGEQVSAGRSLFFARCEIRDAPGQVISYGSGTYKWRRGSDAVEGVPPQAAGGRTL